MLKDIGIKFVEPVVIHCDNTGIVSMSKNPILHSKTRHIEIKYQYIRDMVEKGAAKL